MKQGWEYKKLNEVCEKGSSNIVISKLTDNDGDYPLYGASGLVKHIDFYHQDKPYIGIVKDGAGVGRVNIYPAYSSLVGTMQYIFPKKDCLLNFIKYFLVKLDLSHCVSGATIPHIYFKDYGKDLIPVPSLKIQEKIVSELDKINELIRLKKEQLKDYDNLAQSIFYEMFGDPVENEKGWEVKKIGEIGSVERGAGISKKDFVEDGLPCIHYGQLHTILGARTKKHYTSIPHDLLPKYKVAHTGDLVMAITSEDVEGSCKSTAWLGNYDVIVGSDAAILHHEQDGTFLSYYTMTKAFYNEKAKYAKGFKVTHISTKEIEKISVFLPPLPLQHLFAQRIEQIERQKSAVQKLITDLETILASRMQYWFE